MSAAQKVVVSKMKALVILIKSFPIVGADKFLADRGGGQKYLGFFFSFFFSFFFFFSSFDWGQQIIKSADERVASEFLR